jgi:hypothetical protein
MTAETLRCKKRKCGLALSRDERMNRVFPMTVITPLNRTPLF